MILLGEPGPGAVDDRDLMTLSDWLVDEHGDAVTDEVVPAFVASPPGAEPELRLALGSACVRIRRIDSSGVAARLNFEPHPQRSRNASLR